jgi:hypothetical protein
MKHISLQITEKKLKDKVTKILANKDGKLVGKHYVFDNQLFNDLKKEINNSDLDVSIIRNSDYVIIKEKNMQKYATIDYVDKKIEKVNLKIDESQRATIAYVDKKIEEVNLKIDKKIDEVNKRIDAMEIRINNNILELFKIGLTPLYKKLDIELPKPFVN